MLLKSHRDVNKCHGTSVGMEKKSFGFPRRNEDAFYRNAAVAVSPVANKNLSATSSDSHSHSSENS